MLYGSEAWATMKRQYKRIELNEMTRDGCTQITNEHIRGATRLAQASKKITETRLNWHGYVKRRDEEHILRSVEKGYSSEK